MLETIKRAMSHSTKWRYLHHTILHDGEDNAFQYFSGPGSCPLTSKVTLNRWYYSEL